MKGPANKTGSWGCADPIRTEPPAPACVFGPHNWRSRDPARQGRGTRTTDLGPEFGGATGLSRGRSDCRHCEAGADGRGGVAIAACCRRGATIVHTTRPGYRRAMALRNVRPINRNVESRLSTASCSAAIEANPPKSRCLSGQGEARVWEGTSSVSTCVGINCSSAI